MQHDTNHGHFGGGVVATDRTRVLVELCVDDIAGVKTASLAGAQRVELCADLHQGGVTPSIGLIRQAASVSPDLSVQVMIRPRGGNFVYTEDELQCMLADIGAVRRLCSEVPAELGVVFGALTVANELDSEALRRLCAAAGDMPATLHKAFDDCRDQVAAFHEAHRLGFTRVLTSGGAATALAGASVLAELQRLSDASRESAAAGVPAAPEVLAGGGVRPQNVRELIERSGVRQVHLRALAPASRGDGSSETSRSVVAALLAQLR